MRVKLHNYDLIDIHSIQAKGSLLMDYSLKKYYL